MILIVRFLFLCLLMCISHPAVWAVGIGTRFEDRLSNLYVFKHKAKTGSIERVDRVSVLVTFGRHEMELGVNEFFLDKKRKIEIYFADESIDKITRVVTFLFGGKREYAVSFDDQARTTLVGSIGESTNRKLMTAFAGFRDDPYFADIDALIGLRNSPCLPINGLRCQIDDLPYNSLGSLSVGMVALDVPLSLLTKQPVVTTGTLKIWAKYFVGGR